MTSLRKSNKNKLTPLLVVFLDSSVILSGLASSTGGSRKLLKAGKVKKLKLVATPLVIEEVAEHLSKLKIEPHNLKALLSSKNLHLIPGPPQEILKKINKATNDPNDVHVVAGAIFSGADVLISLDKKHILTPKVRKTLKPIKILSPKDFWNWLRKPVEK